MESPTPPEPQPSPERGRDEPVKLADVARAAGVSLATASRAMNGRARVDPGVGRRVRELADQLGYRPNRAARALVLGRSGVVGLVLPSERLTEDPYGALLVSAVADEVDRRRGSLLLWLARGDRSEAVLDALRSGLVEGLLVGGAARDAGWVEQLLRARHPVVLLGRHLAGVAPSVTVDDRGGAAAAVGHLLRTGRRRIAHLAGPAGRLDAEDRADGFAAVLSAAGLEPAGVERGSFTESGGEAAMTRLLDAQPPGEPLDAVFAASDLMAFGALRALRRAGRRVPDDVAVVGFDDVPAAATADPPLTTVRQDLPALAARALDLLESTLAGAPPEWAPVVVPSSLVVRASAP